MTGNKWTFLLVRGENQPVKQYSVSPQTLRGLLILSSLIAIFMIGLALSSGVEVMARVEARELHTKNEALDREFATFETPHPGPRGYPGCCGSERCEFQKHRRLGNY